MKFFAAFAVFIFLCVGMLFSCTEAATEIAINIDILNLDNAVKEQFDFSEHDDYGYDEFSFDKINALFGITEDSVTNIIVRKKIDFNNAFNEEIMILAEAVSIDAAKKIETKLKEYREQRLKILTDYTVQGNEAQYYLVEASEIIVEQKYVFWVVDGRRKDINAVIRQYIKDNK
jgi:hypothetical protein